MSDFDDDEEIEVPEDHKLIEFDIDTTNPHDIVLHIICKEHKLDGTDLVDSLEHIVDKLTGRGESGRLN